MGCAAVARDTSTPRALHSTSLVASSSSYPPLLPDPRYADFVLNGFSRPAVRACTLVIALDGAAHALLTSRGLHSFYAECMPTMPPAAALHTYAPEPHAARPAAMPK